LHPNAAAIRRSPNPAPSAAASPRLRPAYTNDTFYGFFGDQDRKSSFKGGLFLSLLNVKRQSSQFDAFTG
jgi:hypothetical protein